MQSVKRTFVHVRIGSNSLCLGIILVEEIYKFFRYRLNFREF